MNSPALQRGDSKFPIFSLRGFSPALWQHSGLKPQSIFFALFFPALKRGAIHYSTNFSLYAHNPSAGLDMKKIFSPFGRVFNPSRNAAGL